MTLRYEPGETLRTALLPGDWINRATSWSWLMRFKLHSGSNNGNWFAYVNHLDLDQNAGLVRVRSRNGSNNSTNTIFNMPIANVGDGQWHTLWFVSDQASDIVQAAWDGVLQLSVPWQGTLRSNSRTDPIVIGDTTSFNQSATIAEVGIYTGLVSEADRAEFVAGTKTVADITADRAVAWIFKKHVPGSFFNPDGSLRHVQTSNTNVDGFVAEPFALTDPDLVEISQTGINLDAGPSPNSTTPAVGWVNENPGDEWVGDVHADQVRWPAGAEGRQLRLLFDPPRPARAVVPIPQTPTAGEDHYPEQTSGDVVVSSWNLERFLGRNPTQSQVDNKLATIRGKLGDITIAIFQEVLNGPGLEYLNEGLQVDNRFPYILTSAYSRGSRQLDENNNFFLFDTLAPGSDRFNNGNNFGLGPWDQGLQLITSTGSLAFGTFEGETFDGRNQPFTATIANPRRFDSAILSRIPLSRHWQLDFVRRRQGRDDSPPKNFPSIAGVAGVLVGEYQPDAGNLIVCCVHLDSAQDTFAQFNRREVIEQLIAWLQSGPLKANLATSRIVIAGDFNGTTDPAAPGGLPGGSASRCEWQKPLHDAGFRNSWIGVAPQNRYTWQTTTLDHIYTLNLETPTAEVVPGTKDDGPDWGEPGGKPDHALIKATLPVSLGERDNVRVTELDDIELWWSWQEPKANAAALGNVKTFVRLPIGGSSPAYDPVANAQRYADRAVALGYTGTYDVGWVIQSFANGMGAPDYRDAFRIIHDGAGTTEATVRITGTQLFLHDVMGGTPTDRTLDLTDPAYETITDLATYISTLTGWKTTIVGEAANTSIGLADVAETNVLNVEVLLRRERSQLNLSLWQDWSDGVQHQTNHSKANHVAFDTQVLGGASDPDQWFKTLFVAYGVQRSRQWMNDFIAAFKAIADVNPSVVYPIRAHMDLEQALYIGGLAGDNIHPMWALQQADPRYQTEILPGINMTLEAAYLAAGSPPSNPGLDWKDPANQAFAIWYNQIAYEVMDGALEEACYRPLRLAFPKLIASNYNTSASYDGQGTPARLDYWTPSSTVLDWFRFPHVGSATLQSEVFYMPGGKFAQPGETVYEADLRVTQELVEYQRDSTGQNGSDLSPWILQLNQSSGDNAPGGPYPNTLEHMEAKVAILRNAGVKEFLIWGDFVGTDAEWNQMATLIENVPGSQFGIDSVTTLSHTRLELEWTDLQNPPALRYRVERSFDGGTTWTPQQRIQAAESLGAGRWRWQDTVLPAATTVTYRLRAVSLTGAIGQPTETASGTTGPDPGTLGLPILVASGGPT